VIAGSGGDTLVLANRVGIVLFIDDYFVRPLLEKLTGTVGRHIINYNKLKFAVRFLFEILIKQLIHPQLVMYRRNYADHNTCIWLQFRCWSKIRIVSRNNDSP